MLRSAELTSGNFYQLPGVLPHKSAQIQNFVKRNQVQQVDGIKHDQKVIDCSFAAACGSAAGPRSKPGTRRCQLDEWEQTANTSKLLRLDARAYFMSTNIKML